MRNLVIVLALLLLQTCLPWVEAFSPTLSQCATPRTNRWTVSAESTAASAQSSVQQNDDDDELVAKRLVVTGDVQGGYVRSCILNEAGRFRRLVGTMTDPDVTSDRAEIYVEGKRKLVDGFIRWCQRGKVGLSQTLRVERGEGTADTHYEK